MADKNGNGIPDEIENDPVIQAIMANVASGGTSTNTANKVAIPEWLAKLAGIASISERPQNYPGGKSVAAVYKPTFATIDDLSTLPVKLKVNDPAAYAKLSKYFTGSNDSAPDEVYSAMNLAMTYATYGGVSLEKIINNKDLMSMVSGSGGSGSSGPSKQTNISITSRYNAAADLTAAMNNLLGRKPTKQEIDQYVKELNAKEKKFYTTTTYSGGSVVTTGSTFDRGRFLNNFVLSKTDFANEDISGDLGAVQDKIERLINDNGLGSFVSGETKVKYLKQLAKGLKSEEAINNELRNLAKISYAPWSDLMDKNPDMTLREIASPYIGIYSSLFEVDPNTLDLTDLLGKTQSGNQLMSLNDFKASLRKDPKFQMTTTAKQEAAAFGASFARSMGVNI